MSIPDIHIGTSGWSYKHWKEIFYPSTLKQTDYLNYFSSSFNTTEINTSFYHLPKPETIQRWMNTVPKDFRFCPKMSRYVTQMKKLNDPEQTLPKFFDIFEPMKKRMGPVLIQLPPNLAYHKDKTAHFFETLTSLYKKYSFALEIRHKSWLEPEAIALLTRYKIAFVIAESGPRFPYAEFITSKHIYLRFHGPDGSYATSYPEETLKAYAKKCLAWAKEGHRIWIYFNNDIHGYAFKNAARLLELVS